MKALNNNRGSMLIILVVAMTLIAVLGASFVSIIGSKNEGFTFIIKGQKANMIARAGVEWAIRYVSDGLSNTDVTTDNAYYSNLPNQPATSKAFADGNFSVNFDYVNDYITVNGTYQGVTETITLSSFRRYLQPLTLIPDKTNYPPIYRTSDRRYLDVPVMSNNDTSISSITITTNMSGRILRYAYVQDIQTGVITTIFDFTDTNFPDCTTSGQTDCIRTVFWGFIDLGLSMKSSDQLLDSAKAKLKDVPINYKKTYKYIFVFLYSAPASAPQHTITFASAPVTSTVKFRP